MASQQDTVARTSTPHDDPSHAGPSAAAFQSGPALVTASHLNLRSSPALESGNIIGLLAHGTAVEVLSGTPRNGFYQVSVPGHGQGWASGKYLDRGIAAAGNAAVQRVMGSSPASVPVAPAHPNAVAAGLAAVQHVLADTYSATTTFLETPTSTNGIALAADAHTPATLAPSSHEGAAPLAFTGLTAPSAPQGAKRVDGPINGARGKVRVVLERLENIQAAFAAPDALNLCGSPEHLTLVPGDEIEIYSWSENLSGSAIDVGFASNRAFDEVFTGVQVVAGAGISYGVQPHTPPLRGQHNSVFGATLAKRALGGYCMRATVKDVAGGKPFDLSLTQAVRRGGGATQNLAVHGENIESEMIEAGLMLQFAQRKAQEAKKPVDQRLPDAVLAQQVRQETGKTGGFNEQGQFYGDLRGAITLFQGKRQLIAAPGSTAYGAAGTNRAQHYADRGATFWVPLHVDMVPANGVRGFSVAPYTHGADTAFIRVRVVDGGGKEHVPTTLLSHADGERVHGTFAGSPLQLQIEFLGGSVTGVYVTAV